MPEGNYNVNSSLLNDSDEDQNESNNDKTCDTKKTEPSIFQTILHNFFNKQKSNKKAAKSEVKSKANKYIEQLSEALCKSVEESTYKNVDEDRSSNEAPPLPPKSRKDDGVTKHRFLRNGECEDIRPLVIENGFDEFKRQNWGDSKKSKFGFLNTGGKKATGIVHTDETDASSSYGAAAPSQNDSQENFKDASGLAIKQFERPNGVFSENESPSLQKEDLMQRISRNGLRRSFSTGNEKQIYKEAKSQSKIKNILKFSFGNLVLNRLYSGSAILKNKGDTNVKFSELKLDSDSIVDTITRYRTTPNPSLLSGGEAVLEGFANSFTPVNFDADNAILFDKFPESVTIPESTPEFPSQTPRAARLLSGGRMADVSSKCSSLPELFPSKKSSTKDVHRPSFLRHLSGGQMEESRESEVEVSVNPISKNLQIAGVSGGWNCENANSFPRLNCSIDSSSLKQCNANCKYCSNTNQFSSISSLSNYSARHESCICNHGYASESNSSATASSEYLEADFEVHVDTQPTHVSELYTESESLLGSDFSNSTILRSFSQYSLNQEKTDKSNRNEPIRNENSL